MVTKEMEEGFNERLGQSLKRKPTRVIFRHQFCSTLSVQILNNSTLTVYETLSVNYLTYLVL